MIFPTLAAVEAVFHAALEHSDLFERERFLASACAGDEALRLQVLRLLRAHGATAVKVLDHLPFADTALAREIESSFPLPVQERAGEQIGPYRLIDQLGEGGMGTVCMAEQERPVRRKVALKVIKPGMDTREVIARFEAERQALALMDHPNIARVLDAGATAAGRPYFVMELVSGVRITEYCDAAPALDRASGWSCSCRSARPCSTRTRRGSSTAT